MLLLVIEVCCWNVCCRCVSEVRAVQVSCVLCGRRVCVVVSVARRWMCIEGRWPRGVAGRLVVASVA